MSFRDLLDATYAYAVETLRDAGGTLEEAIARLGELLEPPLTELEKRIAHAKKNVAAYAILSQHAPPLPPKRVATV